MLASEHAVLRERGMLCIKRQLITCAQKLLELSAQKLSATRRKEEKS